MNNHILDIRWQHLKPGWEPQPVIEIDQKSQVLTIPLTSDINFSWQLSEKRFCPGYDEDGTRIACKFNNEITGSYERCAYCESKVGFWSAFIFGQEPNEKMKQRLAEDYLVYLTFFAPDIVKVGVAHHSRKYLRLIEQDALVAMYIAKAPGFDIQKLERAISTTLGFTESVRGKQKLPFLEAKLEVEKVTKTLQSAYQKVYDHFQTSEYRNWLFTQAETELINQTDNKYIVYPEQPITKLDKVEFLAGQFVGLRAKYLLIRNLSQLYAVSTRQLVGRKYTDVDTTGYFYPSKEQGGGQYSLFG